MRHYSNTKHVGGLDLLGNHLSNVTLPMVENWPLEPRVGSFIFKDKRVMICLELADSPIWIPMTQELYTYEHRQVEALATWTINHNMNSTSAIVQCFDETGKVVIPSEIEAVDNNSTIVSFNDTPMIGKAVVLLGSIDGTPKPNIGFDVTFDNKTVVNVPHMLGYEPVIRVIVDGYEIQPHSILHVDTNNATVEFSSPTTGKIIAI